MSEQTNLLLMTYSKYFPEENIMMLKKKFDQLDESKKSLMYSLQFKDPVTTLILSLLVGGLGIDRFYIGDMVAAVTMNPNIVIALVGIVLAPFLLFSQWFTNKDYMGRINSLLNRKQFLIPFCTFEIMIWAYNIMRHI